MSSYPSFRNPEFERVVTLRDAYRVMEECVRGYLARRDTPVSDFLYVYAGTCADDRTADPAAIDDFLGAARSVVGADQWGTG